jgi:hypothetical protein
MTDKHKKGEIGCLKVQLKAIEKGYLLSKPVSEHCRYDYILDDGQKLSKVQVKYASGQNKKTTGSVTIELRKTHKNSVLKYSKNEIDLILVYIPQVDKIICLSPNEFDGKANFAIRFEYPKNNQVGSVNLLQDFLW